MMRHFSDVFFSETSSIGQSSSKSGFSIVAVLPGVFCSEMSWIVESSGNSVFSSVLNTVIRVLSGRFLM